VRAALVEAGRAVELWIEREGGSSRVGDVHLGRVVLVLPDLPAALVEIGAPRLAFLSGEDAVDLAPPGKRDMGIAAWLTEGQTILVQVTRAAQGEKAVGLTARVRLAGALLSLTPTRPKIVTPRGTPPEARQAMEALLADLVARGRGAVLGKEATTAPPGAVLAEAAAAETRWQGVVRRARDAAAPALLESEATPVGRLLADAAARRPARILVDDRTAFAAARAWLAAHRPGPTPDLALASDAGDLFEHHGVAEDVAAAMRPNVALAGGGTLTIEMTAAMCVIDVDGGAAVRGRRGSAEAALAVNLAAAAEAARQIRLRNLAGAIVVDFISMAQRGDRDAVIDAFAAALTGDPASPQLLGWTRLGHVELTRRRGHAPLIEILCERCEEGGWVKSAATIALEALRHAASEARNRPARAPQLTVHPEIAAALDGIAAPARRALEAALARRLAISTEPLRPRESFDFRLG